MRRGFVRRSCLVLFVALLAAVAPAERVAACSCGTGPFEDMVAAADLAIVGIPEDAVEAGFQEELQAPLIRYTFAVERASVEVEPTVEVTAWSGSGASCGITFGPGERWLVLASRWDGMLQTNLCSGNQLVEGLLPGQRAEIAELLPFEPDVAESDDPATESTPRARVAASSQPGVTGAPSEGAAAIGPSAALGAGLLSLLILLTGALAWRVLRRPA